METTCDREENAVCVCVITTQYINIILGGLLAFQSTTTKSSFVMHKKVAEINN